MPTRSDAPAGSRSIPPGVPSVDFYGNAATWSTASLLHSEPLIERSQLHEWRIKPHRHDNLVQLFLLETGHGTARFDGTAYTLDAPSIAVIPARCVHEFEWSHDCDGYALSIASALISDLKSEAGMDRATFQQPAVIDAGDEPGFVCSLFACIQEEYVNDRPMRETALASLVRVLTIRLARETSPEPRAPENASRAARHYRRFLDLVEANHRAQWTVADYARAIGITPPHLNAICRRLGDLSASRVIHDRILLAARRELVYTDRSIAGIASGLGFSEPTYFSRFFRRYTGMTPKAFRRRSGTLPGQVTPASRD